MTFLVHEKFDQAKNKTFTRFQNQTSNKKLAVKTISKSSKTIFFHQISSVT